VYSVITEISINKQIQWLLVRKRIILTEHYGMLPILVTLIMETICFSETSGLTRTTRRNIPEDGIFHSHGNDNLKSYRCISYLERW
jgi:hypothetical protein